MINAEILKSVKTELLAVLSKVNIYLLVDNYLKYYLLTSIVLFISQGNTKLSIIFMLLKFISSKLIFKNKQSIVTNLDVATYVIVIILSMLCAYTINTNIVLVYE